jgi:hypothetical protein
MSGKPFARCPASHLLAHPAERSGVQTNWQPQVLSRRMAIIACLQSPVCALVHRRVGSCFPESLEATVTIRTWWSGKRRRLKTRGGEVYLVILDGREQKDLDAPVYLADDSQIVFLRLTFLAGA